jgi:hypothetical protein
VDLAEMQLGLKQKDDSLTQAREGVALLDKLAITAPPATETAFQVGLDAAYSYGAAAHVLEENAQKAEAVTSFTKAVEHYQRLLAVRPGDEILDRGLVWSKGRLAKLK